MSDDELLSDIDISDEGHPTSTAPPPVAAQEPTDKSEDKGITNVRLPVF
jgi:hypothetical protein